MDGHHFIAIAALLAQSFFLYCAVRNYRYATAKFRRGKPSIYRPRVALIIPCKGLDAHFNTNIQSFFEQDYPSYRLFFVVEDESDPAHGELRALKDKFGGASHALDTQILVAGSSRVSSQKIFNLLYACQRVPEDTEVLAFADSDVCVRSNWLDRLVQPLRRPVFGAATGYRWFVPIHNNPATLALSAINAAIAQFLGNTPFNHAWGGSMAVRMKDFRRLEIPEVWSNTLSDDLSLSQSVKRAGLKVAFVPECLVASFESMTWPRLFEFGRRQFLIARVYTPRTWWLGFLSSLGSVAGFWGAAGMAVHAVFARADHVLLYAAISWVFLAGQIVRAVLRQLLAGQILTAYRAQLLPAALADILGCWLWSIVLLASMLSSAVGRTIRWRGIRYKLVSPTRTVILDGSGPSAGSSA